MKQKEIEEKVKELLLPALRQYRHNNSEGFISGFDYDETVNILTEYLYDLSQYVEL